MKKFIKKVFRKCQLIKRWYFPPKLKNEIDVEVLSLLSPFKEEFLDSRFLEEAYGYKLRVTGVAPGPIKL